MTLRRILVWVVTAALTLLVAGAVGCVPVPVPIPVPSISPDPTLEDPSGAGVDMVERGPALTNVTSLPVDASGKGTIQGAPTGEATVYETRGTFVLVLYPAPAGLPPRTTVHVAYDRSTKVYRNGQLLENPLTAFNDEDGPGDADPSASGSVIVHFHVKDGRPFADRLDLSDDPPPGLER